MTTSMTTSETTSELVRQARQHSLGDLPRRTARRFPDRTALVDGPTRMTFAELDRAVDAAAAAIAEAGLAPGDRLALLCHNCWQFAVFDFATARVGVVLVPVNFMLGATEVAFILDKSRARAFVVEDGLLGVATDALAQSAGSVATRAVVRLGLGGTPGEVPEGWVDAQEWFDHGGTPPVVLVGDDDPVRMMFTSGTESRPKGALLTSRALMWQYVSCALDGEMSPDDVELHTLPLYHCAQLDCFLGVDVYLGATSVILPGP
ncbi:MAG: AMP-binding protein, partial [Nocardioides sp.]